MSNFVITFLNGFTHKLDLTRSKTKQCNPINQLKFLLR